jgi:hypothetical protein
MSGMIPSHSQRRTAGSGPYKSSNLSFLDNFYLSRGEAGVIAEQVMRLVLRTRRAIHHEAASTQI